MMDFTFLNWIAEQPPRADKSAPTDVLQHCAPQRLRLNTTLITITATKQNMVMKPRTGANAGEMLADSAPTIAIDINMSARMETIARARR
jgi:hypothetical protein